MEQVSKNIKMRIDFNQDDYDTVEEYIYAVIITIIIWEQVMH